MKSAKGVAKEKGGIIQHNIPSLRSASAKSFAALILLSKPRNTWAAKKCEVTGSVRGLQRRRVYIPVFYLILIALQKPE